MIEGDDDLAVHGLTDLFGRLAGDAREVARAEVGLVKARISDSIYRYKNAAIFFSIAGVLALATLIALLVGLIITLTPRVGPGWATLIVIGGMLLIVGVLGFIGKAKLTTPRVTP